MPASTSPELVTLRPISRHTIGRTSSAGESTACPLVAVYPAAQSPSDKRNADASQDVSIGETLLSRVAIDLRELVAASQPSVRPTLAERVAPVVALGNSVAERLATMLRSSHHTAKQRHLQLRRTIAARGTRFRRWAARHAGEFSTGAARVAAALLALTIARLHEAKATITSVG